MRTYTSFGSRSFTHSGAQNKTYRNFPAGFNFTITGDSNVTIEGSIGARSIIEKFGNGRLYIRAIVEDNVQFIIRGSGSVIFSSRPAESIIRAISNHSGAQVIIPQPLPEEIEEKEFLALTSTRRNSIFPAIQTPSEIIRNTYSSFDFMNVFRNPFAPVVHSYSSSYVSTSHAEFVRPEIEMTNTRTSAPVVQPPNDEATFLSQCSKHLREYIEIAKNNEKISDKIRALHLNEQEEKLFEEFTCTLMSDYMDIPVCLNEVYYDLSSLIRCRGKDPITRESFHPLEVQSGRKFFEKLDEVIKQLKTMREEAQTSSSNSNSNVNRPRR